MIQLIDFDVEFVCMNVCVVSFSEYVLYLMLVNDSINWLWCEFVCMNVRVFNIDIMQIVWYFECCSWNWMRVLFVRVWLIRYCKVNLWYLIFMVLWMFLEFVIYYFFIWFYKIYIYIYINPLNIISGVMNKL